MKPKYTHDQFLTFCKMFQTQNGFDFNPNDIVEADQAVAYQVTFRDEANYKIDVVASYDKTTGEISLTEPEWFDDELGEDGTREFFENFVGTLFAAIQAQ